MNIIKVEDLTIAYQEKPVIWDIDFEIAEATRTAIIGPNGAGKSTIMKGMLGLIKPISGKTTFWDKPYKEVYKDIAYIPQQGAVNWDFPTTVLDVVTMGRYAYLGWFKRPTKQDKKIAYDVLEKMGMTEFANRQIGMLSGGQKQRVFLARAIVQNAKIYFMDEPLAGVDKKTEKIIMQTIKDFKDAGKTIVVVHHDLNTINEYFDQVIMVNKVIRAAGKVEEVFHSENISKTYGWIK